MMATSLVSAFVAINYVFHNNPKKKSLIKELIIYQLVSQYLIPYQPPYDRPTFLTLPALLLLFSVSAIDSVQPHLDFCSKGVGYMKRVTVRHLCDNPFYGSDRLCKAERRNA